MTPTQFRLSVNRVSFPWEDVVLPYENNNQIADEFYGITEFQDFIDVPNAIRNLYLARIRDVVSRGREEYLVGNTKVEIVSNSDGVLHIKLSTRVVYGDHIAANDHHILALERWNYQKGSSTYQDGVPCIEDYVFELRFMET